MHRHFNSMHQLLLHVIDYLLHDTDYLSFLCSLLIAPHMVSHDYSSRIAVGGPLFIFGPTLLLVLRGGHCSVLMSDPAGAGRHLHFYCLTNIYSFTYLTEGKRYDD